MSKRWRVSGAGSAADISETVPLLCLPKLELHRTESDLPELFLGFAPALLDVAYDHGWR